ncbi:transglycosylase domain-containing protein [Pedococcus sp. NPDC057267]|uniref:transglycosylase domain-containing protein n=1 Tax=Pedococcus sp. NPDC057267 TaxID=3346077 RepID=UPI00363DE169
MSGRAANLGNVVSLLGAFVATALVMGLLAAGLLIPAVGATGSVATAGVKAFDDLPSEFTTSPLSQQSRIVDARGRVLATPQEENRVIVSLDQVAPIMRKAQVAIEDSRFYEHGGVDPRGITRAAVSNFQGHDVQGASTLTQQYVKLTLQENALRNNDKAAADAAVRVSAARKIQEIKYAVTLEKEMTKDQILAGYLNLAYYGDLAYGIQAAAEHYFSVPASKLNLPQAATLAGLVQNPSRTDPFNNGPERAQARRNVVLDRMHELGIINDKDWQAAKAIPLAKMLKRKDPLSNCAASSEPYFCNYVMAYLKDTSNHNLDALGKTVPERVKNITQGGLTIQTTLDPTVQQAALADLTARVPKDNRAMPRDAYDRSKAGISQLVGAAATVIEPSTGRVIAMVQNSSYPTTSQQQTAYGYTQVNWNVDTKYGGTSGFQFGSTAKMFSIVRALESGITVNGTVPSKFAGPTQSAYYSPQEQGSCHDTKPYGIRNDYPIGGKPIPFRKATADSINTAFASLTFGLGTRNVLDTMTKMHLHTGSGGNLPCYASSVLGTGDVTPMTLASSYAILANSGKYCPPNPILSITTPDKKPVKIGSTPCQQVIDPDVANGATELLKEVIKNGTGTKASLGTRPAAGKTGTTDDHVESWFVGYTAQRAAAVWVGTPYSQRGMNGITLAGQWYKGVFGGDIAAPVWQGILQAASAGLPERDFPPPSNTILNGDNIAIPYVSGMSVAQAISTLQAAGFSAQVAGSTSSGIAPGLVVYTNPSGTAVKGTTIGLYLSSGQAVQPPPPPSPTTQAPPPTPTPKPTKKKG